MADTQEIRGTRKQRVIGTLVGWLICVLGWTLRYKVDGLKKLSERYPDQPVILALWHNRILAMPYITPKLLKNREICVLTSASKDGAILETAVKLFGVTAVRGSSSRRGAAALVALRRKLRDGATVAITPDGPKGPRYKVQPGVVKLAQTSGAPIVVMSVNFSSCWRLKSWDRFCVPKPFSQVLLKLEEGLEISREMSDDAFENERVNLEILMNKSVGNEKN
jgi:lysophospholipid acyltransferase (LPLAT)-like uncharacterized protein